MYFTTFETYDFNKIKNIDMKIYTKFSHTFLFLAFFAFVFAGTFSACTEEDGLSIYAINEGRFDFNEDEYVTMKIVSEEGTNNTSAFLRIENHTERRFCYGTSYTLQYYDKNNWGPNLLDGQIWFSVCYGLLAGETDERINIIPDIKIYNNNKKGRYKLTTPFDFPLNSPAEMGDWIYGILSIEFEVK